MSNSPVVAADAPKPAIAPDQAKPAMPQQNQENKSEATPAQQK
ncbi:hypothetical protein BN961_00921 [Afipia felis]|uniref:Uncharacterized protein n=1 Tax=Afipia felis TaxID=1035 RepID=A0A090MPE8_AFIFE|nr:MULTISPECIES: hypothetical protein [Afipia]CEG07529.1 hypothetical protein BN961_00921 [Afipia felis]